jgi:GH18 family chitinase
VASNKDLLGKLPYTTILTYSFMEMITHTLDNYLYRDKYTEADIGLIYFSDPWADLTQNTAICKDNDKMCDYANNKANPPKPNYNTEWGSKMGNFDAFLELPKQAPGLDLAFSVGGYSHDDAFEVLFGNARHTQTFVDSAIALLKKYEHNGLVGIDLDYENPDMTLAQSRDYLAVIAALNKGMQQAGFGTDKQFITVTILGNPQMIRGEKLCNGSYCGFDFDTLKEIADMPFVKAIQLMTYDFNGAFNYNPETGTGITGFNTNIYPVDASDFSIDAAVGAMLDVGVPASKVSIGIPAYGRSLANIPSANGGLFQPLDADDRIPQGNMDEQRCEDGIVLKNGSCSGTFSYRFIVETMLDNGFIAQDRNAANGKPNGATAYLDGLWYPYEIMAP